MTRRVCQLFRVKGERSRSEGYVTYQQQERYNLAVDGRISFKLGESYRRGGNTFSILGQ